jgi:hypothetical protein
LQRLKPLAFFEPDMGFEQVTKLLQEWNAGRRIGTGCGDVLD